MLSGVRNGLPQLHSFRESRDEFIAYMADIFPYHDRRRTVSLGTQVAKGTVSDHAGISFWTSVLLKRGGSSLGSCRTTFSILFVSIFVPLKRLLQAAFGTVRDFPDFIAALCVMVVV